MAAVTIRSDFGAQENLLLLPLFPLVLHMYAQSVQLCLTLCDPWACSPSGSSVHGILQARILEWVAITFSTSYVMR